MLFTLPPKNLPSHPQEQASESKHVQITCTDCNGTGSTKPHCKLCDGQRSIRLKKAYRHGWKLAELDDEGDGYCSCPECHDEASPCPFCWGEGQAAKFVLAQQKARVLIQAKHGFIPPTFRYDHHGFLIIEQEMPMLSRHAASQCRKEGLIHWFCSAFGDELMLTEKGKTEATLAWKEYRSICKAFIQSQRAIQSARDRLAKTQNGRSLSIARHKAIMRKAIQQVPIAHF